MYQPPIVKWDRIEGIGVICWVVMPDGSVGTIFYPYPQF